MKVLQRNINSKRNLVAIFLEITCKLQNTVTTAINIQNILFINIVWIVNNRIQRKIQLLECCEKQHTYTVVFFKVLNHENIKQ